MSRYRVTYSKGSLFGPTWKCEVYDRVIDNSFHGGGMTKKEAKDEAFDKAYEHKRESSYNSSDYSNSDRDYSEGKSSNQSYSYNKNRNPFLFITGLIFLVGSPLACAGVISNSDGGLMDGMFLPIILAFLFIIGWAIVSENKI